MNINPMQIMQMLPQLKSNPMSVLGSMGVPQNISNNPQAIIQNLMNSGKVSQTDYDNAVRMANQIKAMMGG